MIVTQIEQLSKNRCKVYIDQEFAFVLYKGELFQYGISLNKEILWKDFEEIIQVLLPKRAKLRAMNLLQKRTYTEKQLRDKLTEGFYSDEIIQKAIDYVKSFHYINDFQYALDYLSYHAENKSLKQIEQELYRKGIRKDIYMQALAEWEASGEQHDVQKMILKCLEKKHYHKECDIREKQKIYAFLLRKGYNAEDISQAMQLESF